MNTDEYEALIKKAVNAFLGWKLPKTFNPDNGISFERAGSQGTQYEYTREPVGTNLFDATEAEAMFRACIPPEIVARYEQAHALEVENEALKDALTWTIAFFLLPHEGWKDHFERLGEVFRKETGYLRPGKDESPQSGHTYEERQAAWDKWVDDHVAAARKLLEGK